ncbi:TetR/AcrR family transcriptional regulator [Streptomyces rubiginosohelvolus]|uniref:TetR/AcrR family transcriptional regulator n=1 Tax=Streptomyces rubiginosohelvolus TaxID=67362 RepID=UPI00363625B5
MTAATPAGAAGAATMAGTATGAAAARRTQAERRARSRDALLAAAARGLAHHGYAELSLTRVAAEAGYTRGALYHQFAGKEEVAPAVVGWVRQTCWEEVGRVLALLWPECPGDPGDPAEVLLALARAHPVYCRRDMAAVLRSLRVELAGRDHPVGQAIDEAVAPLLTACERLVRGGRRSSIPPGPPGRDTAAAVVAALEAVPIAVAGRAPHDVTLTERAVRGVLGLPRPDSPRPHRTPGRDRAPPRGVARPPAAAWCCAPCPTGHNTRPIRCPGRSRSAPPPS